jgi:hypothetical protein
MIRKRPRLNLTLFHWWVFALFLFMLAGATAGAYIMINGLAITNLPDLVPWGLGPLCYPLPFIFWA